MVRPRNGVIASVSFETIATMAKQAVQASSRHFDGLRFYLEKAEAFDYANLGVILERERRNRRDFDIAWSAAERYYLYGKKQYTPGLTEKQCYALTCYTLREPKIQDKFKDACHSALPSKENWRNFPFKALWCLLVSAFKLLPNYGGGTRKFYRGVQEAENFNEGQHIHFQHFVSASYSRFEATKFARPQGNVLILDSVPPQYVRDIKDFAEFKYHLEVLIWPLCTFRCVDEFNKHFEFIEGEPPLPE